MSSFQYAFGHIVICTISDYIQKEKYSNICSEKKTEQENKKDRVSSSGV